MNPSDVQSDNETRYFDPEEIDMSEQQFAASLAATPEKPQFAIDDPDPETAPSKPSVADASAAESLPVPSMGGSQAALDAPRAESGNLRIDSQEATDPEPDWRSLVSAKVSSYKARKPLPDRYPSLKLPFEPPPPMSRELQTFAAVEKVGEAFEESSEPPSVPILLSPPLLADPLPPRIVMESTARVIEFPRPPACADELAEPMITRPRIVEAPELLPPPPAMGGILIEEQHEPEPERRPGFDVPLQPASLNRRVAAGLVDAAVVVAAVALFGYVFLRINGAMPQFQPAVAITTSLLVIFWPAYQYAFLVYCGKTPGLWIAKLHLARFDNQPVSRSLRRWRVLASVLSLASLGLGYFWCFLDEDQLSWHDRITKTHLAPS